MSRKPKKKNAGCVGCLLVSGALVMGLFAILANLPDSGEGPRPAPAPQPAESDDALQPAKSGDTPVEREGRLLAKWDYGTYDTGNDFIQLKMDNEGNLFMQFWTVRTKKRNEAPVYRDCVFDHETRKLDWEQESIEYGIIEPDGDLVITDDIGGIPVTYPAIGEVELPPKHPFRDWTDASGTYTVRAALKSASPSRVALIKPDVSEISVPPEKLSKADREYLASLRR